MSSIFKTKEYKAFAEIGFDFLVNDGWEKMLSALLQGILNGKITSQDFIFEEGKNCKILAFQEDKIKIGKNNFSQFLLMKTIILSSTVQAEKLMIFLATGNFLTDEEYCKIIASALVQNLENKTVAEALRQNLNAIFTQKDPLNIRLTHGKEDVLRYILCQLLESPNRLGLKLGLLSSENKGFGNPFGILEKEDAFLAAYIMKTQRNYENLDSILKYLMTYPPKNINELSLEIFHNIFEGRLSYWYTDDLLEEFLLKEGLLTRETAKTVADLLFQNSDNGRKMTHYFSLLAKLAKDDKKLRENIISQPRTYFCNNTHGDFVELCWASIKDMVTTPQETSVEETVMAFQNLCSVYWSSITVERLQSLIALSENPFFSALMKNIIKEETKGVYNNLLLPEKMLLFESKFGQLFCENLTPEQRQATLEELCQSTDNLDFLSRNIGRLWPQDKARHAHTSRCLADIGFSEEEPLLPAEAKICLHREYEIRQKWQDFAKLMTS